jgi:hypothetical protein
MTGSRKRVSGVVLTAVIALGTIAPALLAGPSTQGKFQLPFDAHWGKMALPSGDYTFSVEQASLRGMIAVYHDGQAVGRAIPQVFSGTETQSKNPVLVCIRHDGEVAVRALRLPGVGTFYFPLPKGLNTLVTQQPQLIQTVSIQVNGN